MRRCDALMGPCSITAGRCAVGACKVPREWWLFPAQVVGRLFVSRSAEPLELEFGASEEREYRPEGQRDDVENEPEHDPDYVEDCGDHVLGLPRSSARLTSRVGRRRPVQTRGRSPRHSRFLGVGGWVTALWGGHPVCSAAGVGGTFTCPWNPPSCSRVRFRAVLRRHPGTGTNVGGGALAGWGDVSVPIIDAAVSITTVAMDALVRQRSGVAGRGGRRRGWLVELGSRRSLTHCADVNTG